VGLKSLKSLNLTNKVKSKPLELRSRVKSHFEALESVLLIYFLGLSSINMIKLTLVPQNAYLGSQKQ
jgi:hypothetical protein